MSSLAVKVESSSVVPKSLQQIGPAVCRWLVDLPRDVYVNADELARLIGRKSKRTVERMWRRGELPFPVKFAGRNVWLIGAILDFFQTRQAAALKVGGKGGQIMATVFRRKDRKDWKSVWYYRFEGVNGKPVNGRGWPDKKKTKEHAETLEAEARAVRNGEKEAPRSWLKNRNRPIAEIIDEYLKWGRCQGGRYGRPWDDQNAQGKEASLAFWVKELGLTVLPEIELGRVEKTVQDLLEKKLSPKTAAWRVEALRSLCCWAVKRDMLSDNPLRGMSKINVTPIEPHRELDETEVSALLRVAVAPRLMWYQVGLETGFRLNELRCIRVKDLDVAGASIFLAAEYSKNRKDTRQFISPELATRLVALTVGKHPDERLLGIPKGPNPAAYIRADFDKAKVAAVTDLGKATWHSLRKVYINNVIRSGADLKTVMELARHSSATMSMDVYAKAKPSLLKSAVASVAAKIKESSGCVPGEKSDDSKAPAKDSGGLKLKEMNVSGGYRDRTGDLQTARPSQDPKSGSSESHKALSVNTNGESANDQYLSVNTTVSPHDGPQCGPRSEHVTKENGNTDNAVQINGDDQMTLVEPPPLPADLIEIAVLWDQLPEAVRQSWLLTGRALIGKTAA